MLSSINPQVRLRNDISIIPTERTAVGNRGTNPVSKNVSIMG